MFEHVDADEPVNALSNNTEKSDYSDYIAA